MNFARKLTLALLSGVIATSASVAMADAPKDQPKRDKPRQERVLSPLTKEQAKTVLEGRLIQRRSDMTVLSVTDKGPDTFEVKMAKADGSSAKTMVVDRIRLAPVDRDGKPRHPRDRDDRDRDGRDRDGKGDGKAERDRDGRDRDGRGPNMVRENPLTTAQVKDIVEGRLAWEGKGATVGKITEKDGKMIVDVVGADGKTSQIEADPKTGRMKPAKAD